MTRDQLQTLLFAVQSGALSVESALTQLKDFPAADLGIARLDTHRSLRCGFPEVILADGKDTESLLQIVGRYAEVGHNMLITRTSAIQRQALWEHFSHLDPIAHPPSTLVEIRRMPVSLVGRGTIAVVAAGTSDLPVATEARVTAELMGNVVEQFIDVGVAGLHRILSIRGRLREMSVILVVAGMDAALPSVVAGLVDKPVIAVPTSVGYGANFGGIAALLAMLNSCAAGVTVVNIDNGFGGAYAASLINRKHPESDQGTDNTSGAPRTTESDEPPSDGR